MSSNLQIHPSLCCIQSPSKCRCSNYPGGWNKRSSFKLQIIQTMVAWNANVVLGYSMSNYWTIITFLLMILGRIFPLNPKPSKLNNVSHICKKCIKKKKKRIIRVCLHWIIDCEMRGLEQLLNKLLMEAKAKWSHLYVQANKRRATSSQHS